MSQEVFFASLGLFEGPTKSHFRVADDHLGPSRGGVTLLEFGDTTSEELVDDLQFADAGVEFGVGSQEPFVGLRPVEGTVHRRRGRGRRLAELQRRVAVLGTEPVLRQGHAVEHVLGRDIRPMRVHWR